MKANRELNKTQGRIAYESDVKRKPVYHDGTPRKQWSELSDIERWSWERHQGSKIK
jgi:hypothetical protein